MAWNETQNIALAIVPKFTSFLSLLGSSWIIVEVFTEKNKTQSVYHRLLCAMSIYDVLESVWNFCSTWPIPVGSPNLWGASGTTQTCTAQGFFLQLGLAVPMYNASLSMYYLLVIKYNMPDAKLRKRVEPSMHAASFLLAGGTAFAAIGLDLFNVSLSRFLYVTTGMHVLLCTHILVLLCIYFATRRMRICGVG